MGYSGENNRFSFRDNFCEPLPEIALTSEDAAALGRNAAVHFKKIFVGSDCESLRHLLYAVVSGISAARGTAVLCENTDLQSFKYGLSLVNPDCGIFISGRSTPKFSFFRREGFPLNLREIPDIMNNAPTEKSQESGKIIPVISVRDLYTENLKECITGKLPEINISCGNKNIRSLWNNFFGSGYDNDFSLQISDNGQAVNAYSSSHGLISHEKLQLAYSIMLWKRGCIVYLPDNFHYSAEEIAEQNGFSLKYFNHRLVPPADAAKQRFLHDALYMCIRLFSDSEEFCSIMREIPDISSVKREIPFSDSGLFSEEKIIASENGRILISENGKNRISLLVQSNCIETASELSAIWNDKLRQINGTSS